MVELKPLSKEAIPRALERADRYRLLNEAAEAESICLDILSTDPDNQRALVTLILALSDQFGQKRFAIGEHRCEEFLARLRDDYERAYYNGIVCERRGKAAFNKHTSTSVAYEWFRDAMEWFEKAEKIRPAGNDDALLRWNTCARIFMHNRELRPREEERVEPYLE
ncbi:MAG TPA: hypothetical protein VGK04_01960 [Thermoanaerobaculia bacterium]|jgi:hypothetical protein